MPRLQLFSLPRVLRIYSLPILHHGILHAIQPRLGNNVPLPRVHPQTRSFFSSPALPLIRSSHATIHYYRMVLLSRAVMGFSSGYRTGTTISELKVEPSVLGHRARTKEGPLVLVGVTNRDYDPLVPVGNPNRD